MHHFTTIKLRIDKVLITLLSSLLFTMLFCVCWQVFSRYILKMPATFTEELVRFLLIWVGLLGAAYSFGTHRHLSLTWVYDKFSTKLKFIIKIFIIVLIAILSIALLIYGGYKLMLIASTQKSSVLAIPMWIVYAISPISGCLILFYQIYDFWTLINNKEIL